MPTKTITAALLAAALLLTPTALAKPQATTFELKVKGSQVTTWTYVKQQAASCDFPEDGRGSQIIRFYTPNSKKTKLKIARAKGGGLKIMPGPVLLLTDAELEREYKRLFTQQSECPDGGSAGGEGPGGPVDAIGTNKCDTLGGVKLNLGWAKGSLRFQADPFWDGPASDSYHSLPAKCDWLDQPNAQLGLSDTRGEYLGGLVEAVEKLSPKKLFANRTTKVSFDATVNYPNAKQTYAGPPKTTGKTLLAANLTFRRVGGR